MKPLTRDELLANAQAEVKRLKKLARCPREPLKGCLGGVIQQKREALGYTLHQLATISGVAVSQLSGFERNPRSNPTLNNVLKICRALMVLPSEMMRLCELEQAEMRAGYWPVKDGETAN
jgi:DNA-binding XRE family transcriptional regulator